MSEIDIAAERRRALKRRAAQERADRFRAMAKSLLFMAWDRSEQELRDEIAERYTTLTDVDIEELVQLAQHIQRTERVRLDPSTAKYQHDELADSQGVTHWISAPKQMQAHRRRQMKPQQIDMRNASKAQKDRIYAEVLKIVEAGPITPAGVQKEVTRALNVALTYDQAAYLLTRARKDLGVIPGKPRRKKAPKAPEVIVTDAPSRIYSPAVELLPNQLVDDTVAELRARIRELEEENRRLCLLRDWVASHFEGRRFHLDPVETSDLRRLVRQTYSPN